MHHMKSWLPWLSFHVPTSPGRTGGELLGRRFLSCVCMWLVGHLVTEVESSSSGSSSGSGGMNRQLLTIKMSKHYKEVSSTKQKAFPA